MERINSVYAIDLAKNQTEQSSVVSSLGRLTVEAAKKQITAEQRVQELLSRRIPSVFIG